MRSLYEEVVRRGFFSEGEFTQGRADIEGLKKRGRKERGVPLFAVTSSLNHGSQGETPKADAS